MPRIGIIVGSIAKESINKKLSQSFPALAPEGVEFVNIDIRDLPMYSYDRDGDFPRVARDFKDAITMGQPEAFFIYRPADFGANGEVLNDSTAAVIERYLAAVASHVERFAPVNA